MKPRFWAGLSFSALLMTALFALSRAEAATCDRQEGAAACSFCSGTGANAPGLWLRLTSQPCRPCGGTGIHQPDRAERDSIAPADECSGAFVREYG